MPYIALEDLRGKIPEKFLTEALDDDGDGVIDAWTDVEADAAEMVDAYIATRYPVPVPAPLPPIIKQAALVFAGELCYTRRGVEDNPFTDQAARAHKTLEAIAKGSIPLQLEKTGPTAGAVVTSPATLGGPKRRLL